MPLPQPKAGGGSPGGEVYAEMPPSFIQIHAIGIVSVVLGPLIKKMTYGPPVAGCKLTVSPEPLRRNVRITRISVRDIDQDLDLPLIPPSREREVRDIDPGSIPLVAINGPIASRKQLQLCPKPALPAAGRAQVSSHTGKPAR